MARLDPERTVRLSVLDRLMDADPRRPADRPMTWAESVRGFKESLLRDLEWLLNTRQTPETAPDWTPEVRRSLHHYGLPDITSMAGGSEATRQRLLRYIEEAIQVFEPRLSGVRVSPVEVDEGGARRMRFVIEGVLRMDPDPERVAFDTVLEISSGRFTVSGAGHA